MEHLTLADVLCRAVDELVAAIAANDTAKIEEMRAALGFISDANTEYSSSPYTERYTDTKLAMMLDDLLDAIGDFRNGTPWKSTIPTHEQIRSRLA